MDKTLNKGFTLIELMVTLAVAAIVLTIAVPSFTTTVQNNRLSTQLNELVGSLHLARSEAIKRRVTMTVCGSTDQSSCNTSNWENGWLVFADTDEDGAVDAGETIVAVYENAGGNYTLRTNAFSSSQFIQYALAGDIDSAGTFTLCDSRGTTNARAVNINATGRPRVAIDGSDSGTIVEDISGNDVSCP